MASRSTAPGASAAVGAPLALAAAAGCHATCLLTTRSSFVPGGSTTGAPDAAEAAAAAAAGCFSRSSTTPGAATARLARRAAVSEPHSAAADAAQQAAVRGQGRDGAGRQAGGIGCGGGVHGAGECERRRKAASAPERVGPPAAAAALLDAHCSIPLRPTLQQREGEPEPEPQSRPGSSLGWPSGAALLRAPPSIAPHRRQKTSLRERRRDEEEACCSYAAEVSCPQLTLLQAARHPVDWAGQVRWPPCASRAEGCAEGCKDEQRQAWAAAATLAGEEAP